MTSSIAQAIQANPAVYDAKRFYILGHDSRQVWLPAGSARSGHASLAVCVRHRLPGAARNDAEWA